MFMLRTKSRVKRMTRKPVDQYTDTIAHIVTNYLADKFLVDVFFGNIRLEIRQIQEA